MQKGVEAAYLREQAARCRRLAASLSDNAARANLHSMADEYEAKANQIAGPLIDGLPHPTLTPPNSL
jgi:hypothetical protein